MRAHSRWKRARKGVLRKRCLLPSLSLHFVLCPPRAASASASAWPLGSRPTERGQEHGTFRRGDPITNSRLEAADASHPPSSSAWSALWMQSTRACNVRHALMIAAATEDECTSTQSASHMRRGELLLPSRCFWFGLLFSVD
jgi:hypothetical protein